MKFLITRQTDIKIYNLLHLCTFKFPEVMNDLLQSK